MLICDKTPPEFEIAVTPPNNVDLLRFLILLFEIVTTVAAAVLDIAVKVPVPVVVAPIILLADIETVPDTPAFNIPVKTEAVP